MRVWGGFAPLFALAPLALASCAQEEYPLALWEAQHPLSSESGAMVGGEGGEADSTSSDMAAGDASTSPIIPGTCSQANAQPLPQRLVTMSAAAQTTAGSNLVYVSDLYGQFEQICGACHGHEADAPGLGGFRIASSAEFPTAMKASVLAHVTSDGPATPDPNSATDMMPPSGSPAWSPYSKRLPTDPVVQFATLVQAWLDAKSPNSFSPPGPSNVDAGQDAGDGGAPPYQLTVGLGNAMTNLGTCVPSMSTPLMTLAAQQKTATDLDAMFASLTKKQPGPGVTPGELVGLPEHLRDTDLVSFDSSVLARTGVVAFQPAYPLWSDDAGKLRYVRVPVGESIQFDKASQEFVIPDNTRFYKTFMKQIVDTDGSIRWRKIETRLIVARHDTTQNADGTARDCSGGACVNALFGSYRWNNDETDATLVESPLRDGLPFSDTLFLFTTDEQLAADLLLSNPVNTDQVLVAGGAARHYAIPSSERCIQCHMGSNSQSFVLGFRPVQIMRRPTGQGGTFPEPGQVPPTADELSQLQRLISYGVITGITSPSDVLPLEQSEGSRQPRNEQELVAQAYMLGNCSHCHNPRGFPSVTNPVLKTTFNLLPGPDGGIFQFPLEKYSPRIQRGLGGGVQIPYITPSLMDLSSSPKYSHANLGPDNKSVAADLVAFAPWRSLIYRNTDTPFTYTDDFGLFPHMPMNTQGYDCRTKQIMSDWMVSIPAVRKHPEIPEYAVVGTGGTVIGGSAVDDTPQPYVEVTPGLPGYNDAEAAAQQRLSILHTGQNPVISTMFPYSRYSDCPDTQDILDPAVVRDPTCHPVPTPPTSTTNGLYYRGVPTDALFDLAVPLHAHWVVTDLSQIAGTYSPRRSDWPSILIEQQFQPPAVACSQSSLTDAQSAQDEVKLAVSLLQNALLDDLGAFAKQPFPMGLWQNKSGCNFPPSVPTVGSYAGSQRPQWMDNPAAHASADPASWSAEHVYAEWPGAAVFNLICVNCHGPNADAHGRLSDNLLVMTGGSAAVADLRDGLFGPVSSPGSNRQGPFGTLPANVNAGAWGSVPVDDRAARYMAWMGSGGTEVNIPLPILQIVSNTSVLGVTRLLPTGSISANMLAVAKSLCYSLLFGDLDAPQVAGGTAQGVWFRPDKTGVHETDNPALITANGDAELWLRLCSLHNPPPIRAVHGSNDSGGYSGKIDVQQDIRNRLYSEDLFPQALYGSNPVGNDRGEIDSGGVAADNLRPWCFRKSSAQAGQVPFCPDALDNGDAFSVATGANPELASDGSLKPACTNGCWGPQDADAWATRGAINAGFSVFLYLDAVSKGTLSPLPDYTQCEQLH